MTCEDFYETYWCDIAAEWLDESYWEGSFDYDAMFEAMKAHAVERGVVLTDAEEFCADTFFHEVRKYSELGLS